MDEKKSTYKGSTDARRRANAKYQRETVENMTIRVPKGKKEYYKGAADKSGMSLNQFAVASMDEKITRDNLS
ncbi:MAG: hypothetical protein IJI23_04250 [Lachnospiraceae bacterium]|nr:hypothetical protein [Lachnospiraceae bacterium]